MGALNRNSKSASKQASRADQNTFCIYWFFNEAAKRTINRSQRGLKIGARGMARIERGGGL